MIVGFGQKQWMMLRVGVVSEALAVMRVLKLMLQAAATVELIGLAATHSRCRRSLFKASRCLLLGFVADSHEAFGNQHYYNQQQHHSVHHGLKR